MGRSFGVPFEGRLLDVGGGTGRVAQSLGCATCALTVADVSRKMLKLAKAKPGLVSVCCAAEALPFPSKSFERIIMVDALHHVASQPATAGELWRILKPGGRLLIEEPTFSISSSKGLHWRRKSCGCAAISSHPGRSFAFSKGCGRGFAASSWRQQLDICPEKRGTEVSCPNLMGRVY